MTDSARGREVAAADLRRGKRERLVAAARELLYRQGVEKTTLADIAQAADGIDQEQGGHSTSQPLLISRELARELAHFQAQL